MSVQVLQQAIRRSQSCAADARHAVAEFHAGVAQRDMALVIFFCSSHYDLPALAAEMNRAFPGVQVVGCTSAGEIGPAGYRDHSLAGVSFAGGAFAAASGTIEGLQRFQMSDGHSLTQTLLRRLERAVPGADARNMFAFLMIDGLSMREEVVSRVLQHSLHGIAMFGGSASDNQKFQKTQVFCDGAFRADAAVVTLVHTTLPFKVFKTQHFAVTEQRVVVTAADPERRIVHEIDGRPAAAAYAALVGGDPRQLDPDRFAASPVVVLIDGSDYVRSIQKANSDGSLTFYCAIEEGVILRVAQSADLVANLERAFAGLRAELGPPELVIGCDCILRNLECAQRGLKGRVGEIFQRNNTVGFSTYGEQFHGVHINQTLTGLAIGSAGPDKPNA